MIKTAGEVALATVKYRISLFTHITVYGALFDYNSNMTVCTCKLQHLLLLQLSNATVIVAQSSAFSLFSTLQPNIASGWIDVPE